MIKIVKKYAREARKFVREEARMNGVNLCRVDDLFLTEIHETKEGIE